MRFLLLLSLLILLHQPGVAQDLVYGIEAFQVELELREDGSYRVEETITFRVEAGTFRQGSRRIPSRRIDDIQSVEVRSLDVEIQDVQHRSGRSTHTITWDFPERSEGATFVISYDVIGALRAESGRNRIDWDAVGDAWEVPIEQLDVTLAWPDFNLARDSIRYEPAVEGALERTGDGWTARFQTEHLEAGTPYRVVVTFPQQLEGRAPGGLPTNYIIAFLVAFLIGLAPGTLARLRWADASPGRALLDQERPDLELPETAYLFSDVFSFAQRLYPALLFDLTRHGHVTLRRTKEETWMGKTEMLEVDCHPNPDALTAFERDFVKELEQHETFTAFFSSSNAFTGSALQAVRSRLREQGALEDVSARSNWLMLLAFVVAAAGGGLAMIGAGMAVAVLLGGTIGATIGLFVAASKRYRLTEAGATLKAQATADLDHMRTSIEQVRDTDAAEAVRQLSEHLPWLLVDPAVTRDWFSKFEKAIEEAGAEFELFPWIEQAAGPDEDTQLLILFTVIYLIHPSYSTGSTSVGTTGISAGAGVSGGIGGGGGGIR